MTRTSACPKEGWHQDFALCGSPPISANTVLYSSAVAALAALSGYLATTAITPAASATERSICRKSKRPPAANASPPQNSASNSADGQTFVNHCHQKPNGNTKSATNAYAIKFKRSKHKPSKHASVSKSMLAPSPTISLRSPVSALSAMPSNPELPLQEISSCRPASVPETRSSATVIQLVSFIFG